MVEGNKSNMISQQEKEEILSLIQGTIKHTETILDQFEMQKKLIISLEEQLAYYKNINEEMKQFQPDQRAEEIIARAKEDADYIVYDALVQAGKLELGTSSVKRELFMFKDRLKNLLEREWKILEEFDHLQGKK
jgi:hypothetical protein